MTFSNQNDNEIKTRNQAVARMDDRTASCRLSSNGRIVKKHLQLFSRYWTLIKCIGVTTWPFRVTWRRRSWPFDSP